MRVICIARFSMFNKRSQIVIDLPLVVGMRIR